MIATALCVILFAAAAAAAAASVSLRTVLIVHSGNYPGVEQVRAELLALGYQVMLLKEREARTPSEALSAVAEENLASFAIEFVTVGENLQLWLYDSTTGLAPVSQQFSNAMLRGESERMEVLHVVEYLRAALIQSESRAKVATMPVSPGVVAKVASGAPAMQPQRRSAPVANANTRSVSSRAVATAPIPTSSSTPLAAPAARPAPPASIGLTLAPGVALMNKLSIPVPAISGGFTWYATAQWAATLQGLLPLTTSELSRSLGTSDVTAVGIFGLLRHNLAREDSQWRPHLGGGMTVFWVEKRYIVLAPVPSVELGLHWQPRETWSFYASLLAGLPIWVSPDVRKKWGELWEMSSPAIFFASLGVEWRAAASGKRD